ncbi:hypothetical protein SRB5_49760 [Streptomyces sp. RB5]|uniref:Flp family type IVb pilin n=1 Tax=Streptomyces smaragdinus TaxID=2585196 RepID=A0A7K0CMT6_9ACTN|nr:hypothetical protein [Streptomyces smaragdinus]MQY14800.1 hypothetical protein [Streptomyces smaragdinus]
MWRRNGFVLRSLVRSEVRASEWASTAGARLRRRYRGGGERGQTVVEYLGIIVVVVAIIVILLNAGLGNTILNKIQAQIAKLT